MRHGLLMSGVFGLLRAVCMPLAVASSTVAGWSFPAGWHLDHSVERSFAEGDLTGTGAKTYALLMTNERNIRLSVFVNYEIGKYKVYNLLEEPRAGLKSDKGLRVFRSRTFELEPGNIDCASKWINCTRDKRVLFRPPMPVLSLTMGDWGTSIFRWMDFAKGFERFNMGD